MIDVMNNDKMNCAQRFLEYYRVDRFKFFLISRLCLGMHLAGSAGQQFSTAKINKWPSLKLVPIGHLQFLLTFAFRTSQLQIFYFASSAARAAACGVALR
jgi:hypothetical protein